MNRISYTLIIVVQYSRIPYKERFTAILYYSLSTTLVALKAMYIFIILKYVCYHRCIKGIPPPLNKNQKITLYYNIEYGITLMSIILRQ